MVFETLIDQKVQLNRIDGEGYWLGTLIRFDNETFTIINNFGKEQIILRSLVSDVQLC